MKILKTFKQLKDMGYDLSECIDLIMKDSAEYIKVSLLKWPKRVIEYEANNNSSFIRSVLAQSGVFMTDIDK